MVLPLRLNWDETFTWVSLSGLALLGLGLAWLVPWLYVRAFRRSWAWGLGCVVFFPLLLNFLPGLLRRAWLAVATVVLGLALFSFPIAYTRLAPVDLGPLETLVNGERHITLTGWDRTDYSLLGSKSDAVVLQMANPDVTDATLQFLKRFDRLRELDLDNTAVTDVGLAAIRDLPALETLRMKNTRITDAGFSASLSDRPNLKQVDFTGTGVSKETLKAWKAAGARRKARP